MLSTQHLFSGYIRKTVRYRMVISVYFDFMHLAETKNQTVYDCAITHLLKNKGLRGPPPLKMCFAYFLLHLMFDFHCAE